MSIKPTTGLMVRKLEKDKYLVWASNYKGLTPPKLVYEEIGNGKVRFIKATGQLKAILINFGIYGGVFFAANALQTGEHLNDRQLLIFLASIFAFTISLNYLSIFTIKQKVKNQTKG